MVRQTLQLDAHLCFAPSSNALTYLPSYIGPRPDVAVSPDLATDSYKSVPACSGLHSLQESAEVSAKRNLYVLGGSRET